MTKYSVRFLTDSDGDKLFQLRKMAYQYTYGSGIDLKALKWNPKLYHTLNLGVFDGTDLISAYRLDLINSREQAKFLLQANLSHITLPSHLVLGCRACTDLEFQNRGFHYLLRLEALKIIDTSNITQFVSTFDSENPWIDTLKKMGYQIYKQTEHWQDFLPSKSFPSIGLLHLKQHSALAKKILSEKINLKFQPNEVEYNLDPMKINFWLEQGQKMTNYVD